MVLADKKKLATKWKPLERRVPVVLEDDCLDELDAARAALTTAQIDADQARDRMFRLARTPEMGPEELLALDNLIAERVKAQIQPHLDAVAAAERTVLDHTRIYTLRSLGRRGYRELLEQHPPREEDHAAARAETGLEQAQSQWNDETFPRALVAASCADPQLTDDDLTEMFDNWNDAQLIELVAAAVAVNTQARVGVRG
jgi:hypothetical protein